jgi:hypothetical protein
MREVDQFSLIQDLDPNQKKELTQVLEEQWQLLRNPVRNRHQILQDELKDTVQNLQQRIGMAEDTSTQLEKLIDINAEVQNISTEIKTSQERMTQLNKSINSLLIGPEESSQKPSETLTATTTKEHIGEKQSYDQPHVEISRVVRGENVSWKIQIRDDADLSKERSEQILSSDELQQLIDPNSNKAEILQNIIQQVQFNKIPALSFSSNIDSADYRTRKSLTTVIQSADFLSYFKPSAPLEKQETQPQNENAELLVFNKQTIALSKDLQSNSTVQSIGQEKDKVPTSFSENYQGEKKMEAYRISTQRSEIAVAAMSKDDAVKIGFTKSSNGEGLILVSLSDGTSDSTFSGYAAKLINEVAITFLEDRLKEVSSTAALQELQQVLVDPAWRKEAFDKMIAAMETGKEKYVSNPMAKSRISQQIAMLKSAEANERKQSACVFTIQVFNEDTGKLDILKLGDPYIVADPIPTDGSRNPNNLLDDPNALPYALRIEPTAKDSQLPIKQITSQVQKTAAFYSDYMDDSKIVAPNIDWNIVQNGTNQEFDQWFNQYASTLNKEKERLSDDASLVIIRRK